MPQLLVREEELFTELQQALHRARQERYQVVSVGTVTSAPRASQRGPSMSPSQSPTIGLAGAAARSDPASPSKASGGDEDERSSVEDSQSQLQSDFFGDELRGYRLLKAARLTAQEKQHILTLTSNNTRFVQVRRALRTLFADEANSPEDAGSSRYGTEEYEGESFWADDGWSEDGMYWSDWTSEEYVDWYEEPDAGIDEEFLEDTSDLGSIPENERYQQAYAIAQEANKTLAEARQAVGKVRAAQGYYDPAGMKGSSKSFKGKRGKGHGKAVKGKRTSFGPCFICNSPHHGCLQCPDRFSAKGGSPAGSPSKGGFGNKGKGKTKKGKPKRARCSTPLDTMTGTMITS